jgi:hypothetical protein
MKEGEIGELQKGKIITLSATPSNQVLRIRT